MRWARFGTTALSLSVLALSVVLAGCGGGKKGDEDDDVSRPKVTGKGTKGSSGGPAVKLTAVRPGSGTLTGTVKLAGAEPPYDELTAKLQAAMKEKPTELPHCLTNVPASDKDQTKEQDWIVGPDKGVANVFVFLRPAEGTFFACKEDDPGVKEVKGKTAYMHQPYCAFLPHALVLFPSFRDEQYKVTPTGQKFVVTNKSKTGHNFKYGDGGRDNPGSNFAIGADGEKEIPTMEPSNYPVSIGCNVHTWMSADIWVLDNPYYAITGKDGKFEIKNVPVGKVQIFAWHGEKKFINPGGSKGKTIELTAKDNPSQEFLIEYAK